MKATPRSIDEPAPRERAAHRHANRPDAEPPVQVAAPLPPPANTVAGAPPPVATAHQDHPPEAKPASSDRKPTPRDAAHPLMQSAAPAPARDALPAEPETAATVGIATATPDSATLVVEATVVGRETHLQPLAPRARTAPAADAPPSYRIVAPPAEAGEDVTPTTGPAGKDAASDGPADRAPRQAPPAPNVPANPAPNTASPRDNALPRTAHAPAHVTQASDGRAREADIAPQPTSNAVTSAPVAGSVAPVSGEGLPSRALEAIASAVATVASAPPPAAPQAGDAARVITVRLDLPDHGAVEVRIRMADTAIAIRVVADREDTARRIRHQRDELTDALRQAGHDATVTSVESRRVEAPDAARQQQASTAPGGGNASGAGAQGGGERAAAQPRPQPLMDERSAESRTEVANAAIPADRPADRLYV